VLLPARAAAMGPRLVVLDLGPVTLPAPYADLNLGEELGRALQAAGCQVERTCTTEECVTGQRLPGDVHILSFDVRYDRQRFACSISLEVRDRPGGRVEYREKSSSPVCPAAGAVEDTRRAARAACAELRKSQVGSVSPVKLPEAKSQMPTPRADFQPGRGLSTVLVAGGAAALAAGVFLLTLNGNHTSCAQSPQGELVCTRTRQTAVGAIPLLAVGLGGVGLGAWKLLSPSRDFLVGVLWRGLVVKTTF
jgi:hypothetical protein